MNLFSVLKRLLAGSSDTADIISHDEMMAVVSTHSHCLIDVREPPEYASGHIPGAVNKPLSRFDPNGVAMDQPVILVCQAGGRSAKALALLKQAHHPDARHYPPGTGGWRARGGAITL